MHFVEISWAWDRSKNSIFVDELQIFNEVCVLCWPVDHWQSKPSLKLLVCGSKIRYDDHMDTHYCKPVLISWWLINITLCNTSFLSPPDQKCSHSSSYNNSKTRWHIDRFSFIVQPVTIYRGSDRLTMMPRTRYMDITPLKIDMDLSISIGNTTYERE